MTADHYIYLAAIFTRTVVVLLVVYIGLRLSGKRHMGNFNIYDLAMLMAVSNAVQNAMTAGRGDITIGLTAMAGLFFISRLLADFARRSSVFKRRIEGVPVVLIHNGIIEVDHLHQEEVTHDELLTAVREHDIASVREVRLAVLELDGGISVVPYPKKEKKLV